MAVDDVYLVTVSYTSPAGLMQNTLAFNRTEEPPIVIADLSAVAHAVRDIHIIAQAGQITYTTWKARQIRGPDVEWPSTGDCHPQGGVLFEGTFTPPNGGGGSGDMLPPQCAMVTTIKTGMIGRRRRGRFYAGGFPEAAQANGVWASGDMSTVNSRWGTFFTAYAVAVPVSGFRLGVWSHRIASGCEQNPNGSGHVRVSPPNPAQAFAPATGFTVRPTVHTQRRRVAGVGL